jgi:hypothetical protein
MNKILILICAFFGLAMCIVKPPEGALAVLLVLFVCAPILFMIRKFSDEKEFLTNIFVIALLARLFFGLMIQLLEIKIFIAEDTRSYDMVGERLAEIWQGLPVPNDYWTERANSTSIAGWGMQYLVGAIYYVLGRSIIVAQSFCAVFGAATSPLIYSCAKKIYNNTRVAKVSALMVALFPSLIIWSSQILKDGLIIFLLVLAVTMVLQLQKKISYPAIGILVSSLFCILTLRFYIFYMVAAAVAGSFIIGSTGSVKSIVRGFVALIIVGIALAYLGVLQTAGTEYEKYGSLERVQMSRLDLARSDSGFGESLDVSTTEGAIAALPVGFAYLMFAPFPWQVANFRQIITLPEIMIWWGSIPLLLSGLWYTIKNRLRNAISILIFTLLLTIAYSVFQGNVGTAYRQRAQIQVFLFIFVAVGWTLWQERKENRKFTGRPAPNHS